MVHYARLPIVWKKVLIARDDLSSQVLLLTLRRHEKDFMLRDDEKYIEKITKQPQNSENNYSHLKHNNF